MFKHLKLVLAGLALAALTGTTFWFAGVNYDRGYSQAIADAAGRIASQEAAIKEAARVASERQDEDAQRLTLKEQELNEILREISEATANDPAGATCGIPVGGVLRLQNIR